METLLPIVIIVFIAVMTYLAVKFGITKGSGNAINK